MLVIGGSEGLRVAGVHGDDRCGGRQHGPLEVDCPLECVDEPLGHLRFGKLEILDPDPFEPTNQSGAIAAIPCRSVFVDEEVGIGDVHDRRHMGRAGLVGIGAAHEGPIMIARAPARPAGLGNVGVSGVRTAAGRSSRRSRGRRVPVLSRLSRPSGALAVRTMR